MDKQFVRILMLSVLLPAGAGLAEVIDHDRTSLALTQQSFVPRHANDAPADSVRNRSIEGRRFMDVIAAEENTAIRRRER